MKQVSSPLRGVNLGGWLVLEKWMTPSLFAGTDAVDEYTFVRTADAAKKMKTHRDTFITEADFAWLRDHGIQAVRIPVGFWALEQHPPLISAEQYLDWAFATAEKYDLKVLLCLHAAEGSQNGNDHSGRIGPKKWYRYRHRTATRRQLQQLAARYEKSPSLWALELLNEPMPQNWWQERMLRTWTRRTIRVLRKLYPRLQLVFHDAFAADKWSGAVATSGVMMDVHHYQTFSPEDRQMSAVQHLQKAREQQAGIERWQLDQPVIIGEWSLALHAPVAGAKNTKKLQKEYARAQLDAFAESVAWFYWSYKTEHAGAWNFRSMVEERILRF